MCLNESEIKAVVPEIAEAIGGGVFKHAIAVAPREYGLVFELSGGKTRRVLISLHPKFSRVHLCAERLCTSPFPDSFAMRLEKELRGCLVVGVEQHDEDRIVVFVLRSGGHGGEKRLIAELMGPRSNLIVVNARGEISLSFRHGVSGVYRFPPPFDARTPRANRFAGEESPSSGIERHYMPLVREDLLEHCRREIARELKREKDRIERQLVTCRKELQASHNWREIQEAAELLKANLHRVERGAKRVIVEDFFHEMRPREIVLDASVPLPEQLNRMFQRARKLRKGREKIERRLAELEEKLREVESRLESLKACKTLEELLAAFPLTEVKTKKRPHKKRETLPIDVFKAQDGATILVGRSARGNELLTFSIARGSDYWFHARDFAGSHVVLRTGRSAPSQEALLDAAALAKHFSKGANAQAADVSYTQVKHVARAKKAAPGTVFFSSEKTVHFRDDPRRIERLLRTRQRYEI